MKIKKIFNNLKIKREKSLYYKNMQLKKEIKQLNEINSDLKNMNHELIDVITIHNIKIREMFLQNKE